MTQSPLNAAMLRQLADLWHRYDKHAGGWRAPCFRDVLYAEATRLEAAQQGGERRKLMECAACRIVTGSFHESVVLGLPTFIHTDCGGSMLPLDGSGKPELMTQEQIKRLVDRFLNWKLPENFNPDGGISFKKTFNDHTTHPMKHEPSGTNLLDATQAEAMVRHMIDGLFLSGVSREWLRDKIATDPDIETEAGTSHPEAPSPTPETQHPLSDDLTKLGWEMNERRDDEAAQLLFKAAAALNEMTKERDDARKDLASLTDYVEHDNGLKAQLESAKGWEKLNHKRAEAAESQLSLARAVVEAARLYEKERDVYALGILIGKLAAFDAAYPQQDKE